MKKLLMLGAAAVIAAIVTGCATLENLNMSGKWSYKYDKDLSKTGSLMLLQSVNSLTGTSNDAEGEADVKGKIIGSVLTLQGKYQKTGTTYMINAKMCNANEFEGTYTTSVGKSGKIRGKRE